MVLESVRCDLALEQKLVPYTIGGVTKLADFPRQKSPGLPWKNRGYKNKGEVVDDPDNVLEMNKNLHLIGAGVRHSPFPDTCLFARAQVCEVGKEKVRSVWGYPLEVYLEEARFFYPLLEFLKGNDHSFPIGYGCEISRGGMAAITDAAIRFPGGRYMMTDWSKFDKSIPPWLIRDAFDLIKPLMDFAHVRDSEGLIWPVRPWRTERRWKKIIDYFIETPVRTNTGERFLVRGGVPSGSCFTNIIDSIINCVVTRYLCYQTCGFFPSAEIYLGDDGVCIFPSETVIDLDLIADLALEKFGMTLSRTKSYVTSLVENIHFLGYSNYPLGLPYRDQSLLIVSFIYPERSRDTALECAAAALGQLWTNFDPGVATKWFLVLEAISAVYYCAPDATVAQLINSIHRHKYLLHVGRETAVLTVPRPNDFGLILQVLPFPVPSRAVKVRSWDYSILYEDAYRRDVFCPD
jgi:hypothetical protein